MLPFWLQVLTELCHPEVSETVGNKVSVTIKEQAPAFMSDFQTDKDRAVEWFTEEMIEAAHKIPRAENTLHFERLKKSFDTFAAGLTSPSDRQNVAHMDLSSDLSALAECGALLQRLEISCPHCLSQFWYHVNDVRTVVECFGCRRQIHLPIEEAWCYKPNELLWKAIRYHGLVPVARTIRRLFDEARVSFMFASGIRFYDHRNDPPEIIDELDVAWLRNGEVGIAEIKQSVNLFKNRDCERLIEIAQATRPSTVLLAAMTGEDAPMVKGKNFVDKALKPVGVKTVAWPPTFFASPNHYVL